LTFQEAYFGYFILVLVENSVVTASRPMRHPLYFGCYQVGLIRNSFYCKQTLALRQASEESACFLLSFYESRKHCKQKAFILWKQKAGRFLRSLPQS